MEKTNEGFARDDTSDDVIMLGVASIETKGVPPDGNEGIGRIAGVGITE